MNHKTKIENFNGSMDDLVKEIGNLRYDALADFLKLLSEKIAKDGAKDRGRKRIKLATCLGNTSDLLLQAKNEIERAWVICEPYI